MVRPKREFSDEEVAQITDAALNNCHLDTIALALDIPKTTLDRRYGTFIRRLRAKGRMKLRNNQVKLSKVSADMCKFLGVNELNQVVKQTITTEPPADDKTKTDKELAAIKAGAEAYNNIMSRAEPEPKIIKLEKKHA